MHAQVLFSVRDHALNTKRTVYTELDVASSDEGIIARLGPIREASQEVIATLVSPSGSLQATLREKSGENGKKNRSVEIWNLAHGRMEAKQDVTDAHGPFYKDGKPNSALIIPDLTL